MDTKVTLLVDKNVWLRFRALCIEREEVAGRVIEQFMRSQLESEEAKGK